MAKSKEFNDDNNFISDGKWLSLITFYKKM